jgi:hypothetical protein
MKRTPLRRRVPLRATTELRRSTPLKPTASLAASERQRAAIAGRQSIVCGTERRTARPGVNDANRRVRPGGSLEEMPTLVRDP